MFIVKLIPLKDLSEIKIARCFSRQDREVLEQRKGTHEDECPKLAYVVKAEERHINTVLIRREILGFSPLSKVPKMLLQDQSPAEPCDQRMRRK